VAAAPTHYEEQEEEKTELLYGVADAVGRGDKFMKNVKIDGSLRRKEWAIHSYGI
jgi:hypothetical protein